MRTILTLLIVLTSIVASAADKSPINEADVKALGEWQTYVGGWRGAGQPQRGSTKGAWSETSDWAWKYTADHASIEFVSEGAKHIASGEIAPTKETGVYMLTLLAVGDKQPGTFTGRKNDAGHFVFERSDAPAESVARITFRQVAENNRLLVLYERRPAGESRYVRIAEIGYTRQGIQFASGSDGPECVVTGGRGTITVKHEGQTYYVCCTGCKDLFEADPAGILAEYKAKKAKAAEKK